MNKFIPIIFIWSATFFLSLGISGLVRFNDTEGIFFMWMQFIIIGLILLVLSIVTKSKQKTNELEKDNKQNDR